MSGKDANCILLREVRPAMKYLNLYVIVLEVGRPKKTKDGHEVRTVKIADKSGSMNLSVWDELGQHVHPSDILRIRNAYCGTWKGSMTIYTGKGGTIGKVGEFTMLFSELPNFSEPKPELLNQTVGNAGLEEDSRRSPSSPVPASGQSTSRAEGNSPSRLGTRHPYNRPNRR